MAGAVVELIAGARLGALVGSTTMALAVGLQASGTAVAYHRLRHEKEGVATPALAQVFE